MSVAAPALRALIERRAGFRCEYCHLPLRGQVATFPIDHIVPQNAGGLTEESNLALACPHCNGRKWAHASAVDFLTNTTVMLFNPRIHQWEAHLLWSSPDPVILQGKTPTGRATIELLEMNHPNMIAIRRLLLQAGIIALS